MTGRARPRSDDQVFSGIDATAFREGMSRVGSAVAIVTTLGPSGPVGFTASAICSVTDTPPTLLVCLNRSASVHSHFDLASTLCVNILAAGQQDLASRFGGKTPMADRFAEAEWTSLATGAPVLAGAVVSFDCEITERTRVGSHDVLFCPVSALDLGDQHAPALVYFRRMFHLLATT